MLKQVHPDIGISGKAMGIMNSFLSDIFEKLARKSSRINKRTTITSREIQTVIRLVLPDELLKHAVSEGTKAVNKVRVLRYVIQTIAFLLIFKTGLPFINPVMYASVLVHSSIPLKFIK